MARYRKITKRELKHDRFLDTGIKVTRYAKHHKKITAMVIIGLVVIVSAVPIFREHRRNISERADAKLMQAELAYLRGDFHGAFMDFEMIHSGYRRTSAGRRALYFMGHLMQLQGRPDDALRHFEEFLSVSKDDPILNPAALLGIASVRVQLGQIDEAIKSYEETVRRFPDSYFAKEAHLNLAGLKEMMGDIDGSIETYERIFNTYPGTDIAERAEQRIEFLRGMKAVPRVRVPPNMGEIFEP